MILTPLHPFFIGMMLGSSVYGTIAIVGFSITSPCSAQRNHWDEQCQMAFGLFAISILGIIITG